MVDKLHFSSQGQGQTVVFLHGWGVNSAVWHPVLQDFAQHFEVITVDLPGFATNNDSQISSYQIEDIANQISQTVAKPAVYIGWSLGGLVASQIALAHSEQVRALITVASSPFFVAEDGWPGIDSEVLKNFHQQLAENPEKTIKGFLRIQAMGSPNVRHDIKQINDLVMQFPVPEKSVLDSSLALLETVDLRSRLKEIDVPFLRLYGKLDGLVPKKVIPQINQLAPQSDKFIFDKASHAPFISQPDAFNEYVIAWLKSSVLT